MKGNTIVNDGLAEIAAPIKLNNFKQNCGMPGSPSPASFWNGHPRGGKAK